MKTIVVEYLDATPRGGAGGGLLLGMETYHDLDEVEVPRWAAHPMFCTKHFAGFACQQWRIGDVRIVSAEGALPVVVRVELHTHVPPYPEQFLSETIDKGTRNLAQMMAPGTVVEVDFGFRKAALSRGGNLHSNFRYIDSRQGSEMHKRRLAVVMSVSGDCVNVAPITSDPGQLGGASRFTLTETTTNKLLSYGQLGVISYVIPALVQSISPQRILPPVSRGSKTGRDTRYPVKISSAERTQLHQGWLDSVGIRDYAALKQGEVLRQQAEANLAEAKCTIAETQAELEQLRLTAEVARSWAKQMGMSLGSAVEELRRTYAECMLPVERIDLD